MGTSNGYRHNNKQHPPVRITSRHPDQSSKAKNNTRNLLNLIDINASIYDKSRELQSKHRPLKARTWNCRSTGIRQLFFRTILFYVTIKSIYAHLLKHGCLRMMTLSGLNHTPGHSCSNNGAALSAG